MQESFKDNILNGFCDFLTGDILNFRTEAFKTDYSLQCNETIASRIFYKLLIVQFVHSYCVKIEARPYCDVHLGMLMQQTLISEMHNSSYHNLILEQDQREKIAKDVLNNRLTGLDGATKEDYMSLWIHTYMNTTSPSSQLIRLTDRLADIFLALEEMMRGNRRAYQYLPVYVKKLEAEDLKGAIVEIQKWFIAKFSSMGDE